MSKKKPFFSEREVRLARSFLKAIHGNEKNGYLLLAVIAWQRAMTKSHDTFWKSLTKYSAFRAGQLLASKLLKRQGLSPSGGYRAVVRSLRYNAAGATATVTQARDFLLAIELSKWDKDHYGYRPFVAGHWEIVNSPMGASVRWVEDQQEYDPLAIEWAKLTGHNIPKKYFVDTIYPTKPKAKPEPPRQPRSLVHVLPEPDYIQPYAASHFYNARPHLGAYVLPE